MSDENENNNEQGQGLDPERFQNFQKEIERKFGNTSSQLEQLASSNQQVMQLLQELKQPQKPQNQGEDESLTRLLYEDPDKYAELLEKKVEQRVSSKFSKQQEAANKSTQVLQELTQHYPELADQSSDLTKRAVQIFESFSAEDKSNVAVAYRAAINEAATDLGIQRASKRRKSDSDYEDFTLGGGNSNRGSDSRKPKLDARTILFAEAMGMNTDDKNLLKRLAERSKKNYKKGGPVA